MDRDEPPEPSLRPLQGIDTQIGERIRQRRTLLGMSQEALGEALNLSFQQVQKYERGANRVSASRLYEIACIMNMPLGYFYGDLPSPEESGVRERRELTEFESASDPLARRETLELVRAYYAISDDRVRQRLYALIRSLGSADDIGSG